MTKRPKIFLWCDVQEADGARSGNSMTFWVSWHTSSLKQTISARVQMFLRYPVHAFQTLAQLWQYPLCSVHSICRHVQLPSPWQFFILHYVFASPLRLSLKSTQNKKLCMDNLWCSNILARAMNTCHSNVLSLFSERILKSSTKLLRFEHKRNQESKNLLCFISPTSWKVYHE